MHGLNAGFNFSVGGSGLLRGGDDGLHASRPVFPGIAEAPSFDGDIPHVDDDRYDEGECADLGGVIFSGDGAEDAGCGGESFFTSVSTHGPFDPCDGKADDEEGDDVGDHKGAASVGAGYTGKTEKVAESDGAAGDG